jgi:hypothetical protein
MFVHSKIEFSRRKHSFILENFESIKERIRCAPGNRLLDISGQREQKYLFYI